MSSRIEVLLEALISDTDPPNQPQSRVEADLYRLCELISDGPGIVISDNAIHINDIKTNKTYKITVEDGRLTKQNPKRDLSKLPQKSLRRSLYFTKKQCLKGLITPKHPNKNKYKRPQ